MCASIRTAIVVAWVLLVHSSVCGGSNLLDVFSSDNDGDANEAADGAAFPFADFASSRRVAVNPIMTNLNVLDWLHAKRHATEIESRRRRDSFSAQAAADCTSDGISSIVATLKTSCPIIDDFQRGAVNSTVFLASFCPTLTCRNATLDALLGQVQCMAASPSSSSFAQKILNYAGGDCQRSLWSASMSDIREYISLANDCFVPLMHNGNFTPSVLATAAAACNTTSSIRCRARIVAFLDKFPDTFGTWYAPAAPSVVIGFFDLLCTAPDPAFPLRRCYESVKALGRLMCRSSDDCGASAGSWCARANADNNCVPMNVTAEIASPLCASACMPAYERSFRAAFGSSASFIRFYTTWYCSKSDVNDPSSEYCANIKPVSSVPSTSAALAPLCAHGYGVCYRQQLANMATQYSDMGVQALGECLSQPTGTVASCVATAESYLRTAETTYALADIACSTNSNGSFCYPMAFSIGLDACYFSGMQGVCPATCPSQVDDIVKDAGCCLPVINKYLQMRSTVYAASYLPAGNITRAAFRAPVTFSFNPLYSFTSLDRSQQPLNALAVCSNTSSLWNVIERGCTLSVFATNRVLPLAVAWSAVVNDRAAYNRLIDALRSDIALQLGVPSSQLRSDSLVQNLAVSVNTQSASSSRRLLATSAGTSYVFFIDAGSASAASAAAFDSLVANRSLTLTRTAYAVAVCTACLDASLSGMDPFSALSAAVSAAATSGGGSTPVSPRTDVAAPVRPVTTPPSNKTNTTNITTSAGLATTGVPGATEKAVGTAPTPPPFPTGAPVQDSAARGTHAEHAVCVIATVIAALAAFVG